MIIFSCPACGKEFRVADSAAGRVGKCAACGARCLVPAASEQPEVLPPPVDSIEFAPQPPPFAMPQQAHQVIPQAAAAPMRMSGPPGMAQQINVNVGYTGNTAAIVGLILALLALAFCWIPVFGLIVIPMAGLALILAIVGFVIGLGRKNTGLVASIGAGFCAALAIVVSLVSTLGIFAAAGHALSEVGQRALSETPPEATVGVPDGRGWLRLGDMRVRVLSARIDNAELKSVGATHPSKDPYLLIAIEVENLSESKKIDFAGFSSNDQIFASSRAQLSDDLGNSYREIGFGLGMTIVGQATHDSLYPAATQKDLLAFEPPVDKANHLELYLDAAAIDGLGKLHFRIPSSIIKRTPAD